MTSGHEFVAADGSVSVVSSSLEGVDFGGIQSEWWSFTESRLVGCTFADTAGEFVFGAGRTVTEWTDCVFDGGSLRAVVMGHATFVRCSFLNTRIYKWLCKSAEFVDCTFSGTVEESNFHRDLAPQDQISLGRDFNRIEGNDFSQAEFKGVIFGGGVELTDQKLPAGPGYLLVPEADIVLPQLFEDMSAVPDSSDTKKFIISRLRLYLRWEYPTQRQWVFSPRDWVSRDGTRERAFAELTERLGDSATAVGAA